MKPALDCTQRAATDDVRSPELIYLAAAAMAIVSSVMGWTVMHFVFKPLTMLLAIGLVLVRARRSGDVGQPDVLLVAALVASLAGDVFLMLPGGYFIPGLASFLIAHLFYIALFQQGVPWFPSRLALGAALTVGAAMYGWVWLSLNDPLLKVAVASYVTVISLMVAQAIGRATMRRNARSTAIALGACIFMLSDSLIAINRFVQPVPLVSLWVLTSYYMAQFLMVHNLTSKSP